MRLHLKLLLRHTWLPFAVVALLAQVSLGWPVDHPGAAAASCVLLGVLLGVGPLVIHRAPGSWAAAVAPLAFVALIALWREADGGSSSGFAPMAVLPVIWLALHGTRTQVWASVAAITALFVLPIVLVGAPEYPATDWRRALLWSMCAALVGPTVGRVVRERESQREQASTLRPSDSLLRGVLRAAVGNSIVACDLDGTIRVFNEGAGQLLGRLPDEVVGRLNVLSLLDPEELAERARELGVDTGLPAVVALVDGGSDHETRDWTYLRADGPPRRVSQSVSGLRDAEGRPSGYVLIGTDVTDTRSAYEALASDEKIYRTLVSSLPMTGVGLIDENMCWVKADGNLPGGLHAEDLIGRPVGSAGTPDSARVREFFTDVPAEGRSITMALATGTTHQIDALPVTGPGGRRLILTVARDVTEQFAAQAERESMLAKLEVSELRFREAFEAAPFGMAVTTVEDAVTERFVRVNPAFARLLGRTPEEFVGVPVAQVTHPEDIALQPDLAFGIADISPLRKRFLRPSGRAVWLEVSYTVIRAADGTPSHVIKQVQDVDAVKESERALLDALEQQRAVTARLAELDRIRTNLVGTVSHELRTPLTSVHGYLQLLADEPLTDGQQAMIAVALRNSTRLKDLVDDLLVLVRLDAAENEPTPHTRPRTVDVVIADTVRAAVETIAPVCAGRHQVLRVTGGVADAVVRGDAEHLDRVLINLLSNASKYTPDGGRIAVDTSVVDGQVVISVQDNGIGIPLDEQDRLFERFFRASTAREKSIAGNGLGLAIVKAIVERHGGTVRVRSAREAGSVFSVALPLAPVSAVATA